MLLPGHPTPMATTIPACENFEEFSFVISEKDNKFVLALFVDNEYVSSILFDTREELLRTTFRKINARREYVDKACKSYHIVETTGPDGERIGFILGA